MLYVENYGDVYPIAPGHSEWDRHPLLEAAIEYMRVPDDVALHITVYSEVPAGCSTGTSASITVALMGALDRLTPGTMTPHEVAYAAHRVETDMLHLQSGIQDRCAPPTEASTSSRCSSTLIATVSQISSEYDLVGSWSGGWCWSSWAERTSPPRARDRDQEARNERPPSEQALATLRRTAEMSRDAVYAGDFAALGRAMAINTEAQADLHPDLVSSDAHQIIDIAREHGAIGWKVNGAGGDGGSLTRSAGRPAAKNARLIQAIRGRESAVQEPADLPQPLRLRVWE